MHNVKTIELQQNANDKHGRSVFFNRGSTEHKGFGNDIQGFR